MSLFKNDYFEFFLLSNFFLRENIKKKLNFFFTGENANNNLMF